MNRFAAMLKAGLFGMAFVWIIVALYFTGGDDKITLHMVPVCLILSVLFALTYGIVTAVESLNKPLERKSP